VGIRRAKGATIPGLSGTGYEPQTNTPAFTDVRIFMMLTSLWESPPPEGVTIPGLQESLRSPNEHAGFHGCANLHVQFPQTTVPTLTVVRILIALSSFPSYYTLSVRICRPGLGPT
jgi:hypothetical protein